MVQDTPESALQVLASQCRLRMMRQRVALSRFTG